MTDLRIQYNEEMVGANHSTKSDTLNRLALAEHNNDGSHKYFEGYVNGLWVRRNSNSAVYVTGGEIVIVDGDGPQSYNLETQTAKSHGQTGTKAICFYVKPPASGRLLSVSEIECSDTAPTWDHAKHGFYHPANPAWRYIGGLPIASNNLLVFRRSPDNAVFLDGKQTVVSGATNSTMADVDCSAITPNIHNIAVLGTGTVNYSSAGADLEVRPKNTSGTGFRVAQATSTQTTNTGPFEVTIDSAGQFQARVTNSGSDYSLYINGYRDVR